MCSNSVDSAHVILKYLNQTKIKGGCQWGRKVAPHDFKSDLPLTHTTLESANLFSITRDDSNLFTTPVTK